MAAVLVWCVFALALIPAFLFVFNLFLYRAPKRVPPGVEYPISILIPARDEERCIEASLRAALASRQVDLEVIVLDDHSEDRTAAIVKEIAAGDARVRFAAAPPLPAGWCGKQHACSVLAALATKPTLCFIDADVRLSPNGVAEMIGAMHGRGAALISGFPWQEVRSPFEQLLLPLMHFLLLGYLPIIGMRRSVHPAYGAGCGQIFVADREAYFRAGSHAAIRNSRHDGITLPRAFRRAGFLTDLCDATGSASCRMYTTGREVMFGLLKNATEGIGSSSRIVPFSLLLLAGQVLPLAAFILVWSNGASRRLEVLTGLALVLSYLPRVISVWRFKQPLVGALLHPVAIIVLLSIQWLAWSRSMLGVPSIWKGRSYSTT